MEQKERKTVARPEFVRLMHSVMESMQEEERKKLVHPIYQPDIKETEITEVGEASISIAKADGKCWWAYRWDDRGFYWEEIPVSLYDELYRFHAAKS